MSNITPVSPKGKGLHSPSVSKSLPRTPVSHTRLYPELNADVEDVELRTEEAPEQSGPGLTVRKKSQHPKTIKPVESTLINDIYLKLESDPESADENDDFSSVKSHNDLEVEDYACRLQKLYSFAYPKEVGKTIDADVLKLRETMLMDGFLGGLKSNLRERMSFKDYRNLNDLVKATEKCAAILNEGKLEKRSFEFVNAVSANANAQELRETKNEILELKSVIEQL
ncbi:hypothetical protein OUZ56_026036 [Daphnia magna]|uniref:Uncharacterized protein n=1 Tax=Daphnia magna TaxID=35525 RepID=A0ABQ9ZLF5_9CRUS|nr:hypothetical protein OUZ56_026036 [Daphnia magna]